MGPFFHGLLARRRAEVKGGKRSAAAERERSRETKYKSSDHACFKVGRTDGRTDGRRTPYSASEGRVGFGFGFGWSRRRRGIGE